MSKNRFEITVSEGSDAAEFEGRLVGSAETMEDKSLAELVLKLAAEKTLTVEGPDFQKMRGFMVQLHKEAGYTVPKVTFKKHAEIPLDKSMIPKKAKKVKAFRPTRKHHYLVHSFDPTVSGSKLVHFCRNYEKAQEAAEQAIKTFSPGIQGVVVLETVKLDSDLIYPLARYLMVNGEMLVSICDLPKIAKEPKEPKESKKDPFAAGPKAEIEAEEAQA